MAISLDSFFIFCQKAIEIFRKETTTDRFRDKINSMAVYS